MTVISTWARTERYDIFEAFGGLSGFVDDMMKQLALLASLAAMFLMVAWIPPAPVAQSRRGHTFTVGVIRTDGVIVPFARYANLKWTNPWRNPVVSAQAHEPNTIADLRKPWYESFVKPSGEWYLSLPSGDALNLLTSRNVQVCSHCQQVWGLLSDYPGAEPAQRNACVRTLGIAFSKKRPAQRMERLTSALSDWKEMLTFLGPEFERAENAGPTEAGQQYYAQIPRAEDRAKVPLSMLNLYRSQLLDGRNLFYFEVSKEYRRPRGANDADCNNISLFGGWALRDVHGNVSLLDSQFQPTDCDRKEGGMTIPFDIFQLDGKTFAVVEEDNYEGESYIILEIRRDGIHRILETYAGSC